MASREAPGSAYAVTTAAKPVNRIELPRAPKRAELIAADLAAYIADAGLAPGTPLASEREMSESLGVGRATLREAMRLLETRGVLTIRAGTGGGPFVRRPQPGDLREALSLILQFEGATLLDVVRARRVLETAITRIAAVQISDDALAELREVNDEMAREGHNANSVGLNKAFHLIVCDASGCAALRVVLEGYMAMTDARINGVTYPARQFTALITDHERVIDALAAHDPDRAVAAMEKHIDDAYAYWRRRYASVLDSPVRWMQ